MRSSARPLLTQPVLGGGTPFGGVTPFPVTLIDEVMPTLKDTEWRVLCVVVRQTLGWQVDDRSRRRKEADWLAQSQLKRRTGRASEALSKAVDKLVRSGWIEVCDAQGRALSTPAQRRNSRGPAFFRLGQRTRSYLAPSEGHNSAGSEPGSEQTASHEESYSQSEVQCLQSELMEAQSELHKANTTKETNTKIIPYGREGQATVIHRTPVDNLLLEENDLKKTNKTELEINTKLPSQTNPDVKRFIQSYITLFRQQTANGEPPVISWGKDGKIVKQLLELYPYARLDGLLHRFFAGNDAWIRQSGYSVGAFRATVNKLLVQERSSLGIRKYSQGANSRSTRGEGWAKVGWS